MPIIILPTTDTKKLLKPSRGDIFGNLWATKNIDLDKNPGKIRLSERTYEIFNSTDDDADFELPMAFIRSDADNTDKWWALTQANGVAINSGLLFKTTGTNPTSGWIQDAISNTPTDTADNMVNFGKAGGVDRLVVARDTDLSMLNAGTWTASWWVTTLGQSALSDDHPHHIYKFLNKLLVPDGNILHTIDDSLVVVANRITLPAEYEIRWMIDDGRNVYIGAWNTKDGEGLVFPWNGTDETYSDPIPVGDPKSFAGLIKDGILHTINGKGQLLQFNGSGFSEIASLPFKNMANDWNLTFSNANYSTNSVVRPNGMALIDKKINVLLNASLGSQTLILENVQSGIWEFDPERGFYNKYSLGDYDGSTNDSWGSPTIYNVGALKETIKNQGRFLAGATLYTENGTSNRINAIVTSKGSSSITNRGYIITSELQSSSVREFWQRLHAVFKRFKNSSDKINIKYRVLKNINFGDENNISSSDFSVTWTDDDTFTSTGSMGNVSVGDEIEILRGNGAGAIAHISSISESGGTYTVNLDEAIPNIVSTETSYIRVQNWKKLGTIQSQVIDNKLFSVIKRSSWIQLKIELRGTDLSPEIEKLLIEFNPSKR